jgi:dTMP kinase
MLVAIEGIDSSGKNTQSKRLAERIRSVGRRAHVISFPRYATPLGQSIKRMLTEGPAPDPLVLQSLFLADKAAALQEMMTMFDDNAVVICDRWTASGIAYGTADGVSSALLRAMNFPLPDPDLNIFVDVPPEEALRRRPEMQDRYERDREKQAVVRANYLSMWGPLNDTVIQEQETFEVWWAHVDGVGTERDVTDRIWNVLTMHPTWLSLLETASVQ